MDAFGLEPYANQIYPMCVRANVTYIAFFKIDLAFLKFLSSSPCLIQVILLISVDQG